MCEPVCGRARVCERVSVPPKQVRIAIYSLYSSPHNSCAPAISQMSYTTKSTRIVY